MPWLTMTPPLGDDGTGGSLVTESAGKAGATVWRAPYWAPAIATASAGRDIFCAERRRDQKEAFTSNSARARRAQLFSGGCPDGARRANPSERIGTKECEGHHTQRNICGAPACARPTQVSRSPWSRRFLVAAHAGTNDAIRRSVLSATASPRRAGFGSGLVVAAPYADATRRKLGARDERQGLDTHPRT